MTTKQKQKLAEQMKRMYDEGGVKTKGFIDGTVMSAQYYNHHKSGKRQLGFAVGCGIANTEIIIKHLFNKVKK